MSQLRTRRAVALATIGLSMAVVVAGCSTPSGDDNTSGEPTTPVDTAGVDHANAQLETYRQVVEGYLPDEPLADPAALAGKKVMYIPAVAAIPFFVTSWTAVQAAFGEVGVEASICDGHADPALTSACLDQALNQGYSGVIMDALAPAIAQQSFDAVVNAGIPVVLGNIPTPAGSPENVVTVGPDTVLAVSLAADAIIAKSGGSANVVAVKITDSPVTEGWFDNGIVEFETYCPDCIVTTVESKTAELDSLPSKVSAAILANPGIDYLLPSLDPARDATVQGAADAGQPNMPTASTATTLGALQALAAGKSLFASVGWDLVRTSWYEADVLNRLMIGQVVDATKYVSPVRVFDETNIGELDVSEAGWGSSDWYGGDAYQDVFRTLWQG